MFSMIAIYLLLFSFSNPCNWVSSIPCAWFNLIFDYQKKMYHMYIKIHKLMTLFFFWHRFRFHYIYDEVMIEKKYEKIMQSYFALQSNDEWVQK